jgi:hypothetical protein
VLPEKVEANETLRARQTELGLPPEQALPYLCECDDVTCRSIILLTAAEYADIRASDGRCVCAEGHPGA